MSQFCILLLSIFLCKMLAVSLGAFLIEKRYQDILGSILGAWCLTETFLILEMLFLSVFHALTMIGVWTGLLLLNVFLVITVISSQNFFTFIVEWIKCRIFFSKSGFLSLIGIMIIFSFLAYHSLYFFDSTADAIAYELTRILFYVQDHSLFVMQPTIAFNIFSNEWNGELNSLFYVLATANDQASSFGNVEIWLFLCLSYAWVAGLLGTPERLRLLGGFILGSAPVWLGLAVTVKGDLLMALGVTAGIGFVWNTYQSKSAKLNYAFSFAALGLASGSKIVALPLLGFYLIQLTLSIFLRYKKYLTKLAMLSLTAIIIVITNARYFINSYVYGDPTKHVEPTQFAFTNINENLVGVFRSFFDLIDKANNFTYSTWALNMGMGVISFALIGWIILRFMFIYKTFAISKKITQHEYFWKSITLSGLIISTLFLLTIIEWRPWAFRYFAPFFFISLVFVFSSTARYFEARSVTFVSVIWLILVGFNVIASFWGLGEKTPVSFATAKQQSQMERKLAFHLYLWEGEGGLTALNFNSKSKKSILIINAPGSIVAPFFGVNNQNIVTLVDNMDSLKRKIELYSYDIVAITPGCRIPPAPSNLDCPDLPPDLMGYRMKINTPNWTLYLPAVLI